MVDNKSSDKVRIAFLLNPDPVFSSDKLDNRLIELLRAKGAEVIEIQLEDLFFKVSGTEMQLINKDKPLYIDGMLNYGHMSPQNLQLFYNLIFGLEAMNIICLHTNRVTHILNNKLHQGFLFAQHKIPIPETFTAFSIPGFKNLYK